MTITTFNKLGIGDLFRWNCSHHSVILIKDSKTSYHNKATGEEWLDASDLTMNHEVLHLDFNSDESKLKQKLLDKAELEAEIEELREKIKPLYWHNLAPGTRFKFTQHGVCIRTDADSYVWVSTGELINKAQSTHNKTPVTLCKLDGGPYEDH